MGVNANIQIALDTRLSQLESNILQIAWPNVNYNPTVTQIFLRPSLIPGSTELYTLANQHKYIGIYQIDIYVPLNRGTHTLNDYADQILDLFNADKTLVANGTTVFIQAITPLRMQREENHFSGGIEISYICYA